MKPDVFAERMTSTGQWRWWLGAALVAALSAISKVPFFMAAGLCVFFLLISDPLHSRCWRSWAMLGSVAVVSGIMFVCWTRYTNYLASLAEFPYVELRVGRSRDLAAFFFGDWHFRLNPFNWAKGGWPVLNCTLGSFALIILPAIGMLSKDNRLAKFLLLGGLMTTMCSRVWC